MSAVDRLAGNPFYVLELTPDATDAEVERQGQKLLAMLGVGLTAAAEHPSLFGSRPRTADDVRRAVDTLRKPHARAEAEAWFDLPVPGSPAPRLPQWLGLRERLGWQ